MQERSTTEIFRQIALNFEKNWPSQYVSRMPFTFPVSTLIDEHGPRMTGTLKYHPDIDIKE
jgi:hypothetical protein